MYFFLELTLTVILALGYIIFTLAIWLLHILILISIVSIFTKPDNKTFLPFVKEWVTMNSNGSVGIIKNYVKKKSLDIFMENVSKFNIIDIVVIKIGRFSIQEKDHQQDCSFIGIFKYWYLVDGSLESIVNKFR